MRLGQEARSLFAKIACERAWLPFWACDELDYKECLFFPGNPGLTKPLSLCFSVDCVTFHFEAGDSPWFALDEEGLGRFRAALDATVQSQASQAPG
jgi:hypothetical protein